MILKLISKDTRQLRALVKTQPATFKGKSSNTKAKFKEYRKWFFNTDFFRQNALLAIEKLVLNGQNSTQEILKFGFTGLAKQNMKLLDSNQLTNLQSQFELVVEELNLI